MLTVARAAADAALAHAATPGARAREVFAVAAQAAREALARTPEQLAVLAEAGVVDAGGRGICVILDAAETVLTGRRPVPVTAPLGTHTIPTPVPHDLVEGGPAYEVMYLLDADDDRIPHLKATLGRLGDSRGRRRRRAAVERPRPRRRRRRRDRGRPGRGPSAPGPGHALRRAGRGGPRPQRRRCASGRRIVAVAAGPGLHALFEGAGAVGGRRGPGRPALDRDAARGDHRLRRRRGRGAAQRPRLRPGRRDRRPHRRGRPRRPGRGHPHRRRRCRVSPRSPSTSPAAASTPTSWR